MDTPLEQLRQRSKDNWLLGYDSWEFLSLTEALFQEFTNSVPQKILLAESDPIRFLASFIAATSRGHHVFLGNPGWGSSEWQQVFDLVKPNIVWGNCEFAQQFQSARCQFNNQSTVGNKTDRLIMIPTGGSSGTIRFAMHTWQTLMASVEGFREYFQLSEVNSICTLPLYHVSGLMQFMRSFTSGGRLLIVPFKEIKTGQWCSFDPSEFFISLVPTQLQCLLSDLELTTWLSRCQTVLLGGAPAWSELFDKARFYKIKLAPTYGMTETASQIATLKSESFLSGNKSNGQILPHAKVKISTEDGELLCSSQTGRVTIQSTSLALGYYPEPFTETGIFHTDDIGFLDADGNLNIVCRSSDKIITGGENVFPCEVEATIRATDLVKDIMIIGLPDKYWGQVITAVYVPLNPSISSQQIQNVIEGNLTSFKRPKLWISLENMPRNEQGKINRKHLQQLVMEWQQQQAMV
jgi:O-succinylbenzoic acid--CoA ligase